MWVAARFDANMAETFVLGDGGKYGDLFNRPLKKDVQYSVFVRAYTTGNVSTEGWGRHCTLAGSV